METKNEILRKLILSEKKFAAVDKAHDVALLNLSN